MEIWYKNISIPQEEIVPENQKKSRLERRARNVLKWKLARQMIRTAEMINLWFLPPEDAFEMDIQTIIDWVATQPPNFPDRLTAQREDGLVLFNPFWELCAKHHIFLSEEQKKTIFLNFIYHHGLL